MANQILTRASAKFGAKSKSLGDYLIHVVVLVGGQASCKMNPSRGGTELFVLLVKRRILGPGDRVVGVTAIAGILIHDAGLRVDLTGQLFELGDPSVLVIVGVVDNRDRLELRDVYRFVTELQRPVRQFAESIVEELVHRAGVYQLAISHR